MGKYADLLRKIETGLAEQRRKGNLPNSLKIAMVVPEEELKRYSAKEVLVAAVESGLMISGCTNCASLKIAGRWIPASEYTKLVKENYDHISWTYCEEHAPTVPCTSEQ